MELVVARQAGEIYAQQSRRARQDRTAVEPAAGRRFAPALIQSAPRRQALRASLRRRIAAAPGQRHRANGNAGCSACAWPDLGAQNASVVTLRSFCRSAAERRGDIALGGPTAPAMSIDWSGAHALTYISIGFFAELIYAEATLGDGHNMLSVVRVCDASRVGSSRVGYGLLRGIADIRTLATKCCHNLRQRRLVWCRSRPSA